MFRFPWCLFAHDVVSGGYGCRKGLCSVGLPTLGSLWHKSEILWNIEERWYSRINSRQPGVGCRMTVVAGIDGDGKVWDVTVCSLALEAYRGMMRYR